MSTFSGVQRYLLIKIKDSDTATGYTKNEKDTCAFPFLCIEFFVDIKKLLN